MAKQEANELIMVEKGLSDGDVIDKSETDNHKTLEDLGDRMRKVIAATWTQ